MKRISTNSLILQKNGQKYLKCLPVFTTQYFKSMFDHFSTLRRKELNYNFQEYFKGIISIIFCKTLTLRNIETLHSIARPTILLESPSRSHA